MVADAPRFEELAQEIHERLQGVGIVAYTDPRVHEEELKRVGLAWPEEAPTLDPLFSLDSFSSIRHEKTWQRFQQVFRLKKPTELSMT